MLKYIPCKLSMQLQRLQFMFHVEYLFGDEYCFEIKLTLLEINLSNLEGVTQINNDFMIILWDAEASDVVVEIIGFWK